MTQLNIEAQEKGPIHLHETVTIRRHKIRGQDGLMASWDCSSTKGWVYATQGTNAMIKCFTCFFTTEEPLTSN